MVLLMLFMMAGSLIAQEQKLADTSRILGDSTLIADSNLGERKPFNQVIDTVKKIAGLAREKSKAKYEADRILAQKTAVLNELRSIGRRLSDALSRGYDSTEFRRDLDRIVRLRQVAGDGIFTNKGTAQTARNLDASKVLLNELLVDLENRENELTGYAKELAGYRSAIDSLSSDSSLYVIPDDSADAVQYLKRLSAVSVELSPIDSSLTQSNKFIQAFANEIALLKYGLQNDLKLIGDYRKDISIVNIEREFSNLGGDVGYARPFREILRFSGKKGLYILNYYAQAHWGKIFLMLLFIYLFRTFLRNIKKRTLAEQPDFDFRTDRVVLRYPWLSAIFITVNVFQFFFPDPPFVFYGSLWVLAALCITFISWGFISKYWSFSWGMLTLLFVLTCIDNNILQASRVERWFMQILSLAGIILVVAIFLGKHKDEMKEPRILFFIGLLGGFLALSIAANHFGRYNLAKLYLTAGYFNVAVGVMLLWTVRFINSSLQFSSNTLKRAYNKMFYVDFSKINESAPRYIYVLMILGWAALVARNFYFYSIVMDGIRDYLSMQRTIGSFTYTIGSLFTFIVVLIIATMASKIVGFFASENEDQPSRGEDITKSKFGSWLLLVRIGIITAGILVALAASGIPLDRITIVLGALGVGIGLGLQAIVNNLVSGLIIAFEKPVNVGDVIELAGRSGIMKSIGFRSSIIATWDGSEVIIPNGDLLNHHLINWTGQNNMRRVEVLVGVAYGTDLALVKEKLLEMLRADERVMNSPEPIVLVTTFNNSSVDFRVLFWVYSYTVWLAVKSDVMLKIDQLFKAHKITIPFPQQDIHIKSSTVAEVLNEQKSKSADKETGQSPKDTP